MTKSAMLAVSLPLFVIGANAAAPGRGADKDQIEAYVKAFNAHFARGDTPPPRDAYASAERFDTLYMGDALQAALDAGLSNEEGGFPGEDVSHGALTMALPIMLAEAGEVFTREDMQRLGRTVTRGFATRQDGVLFGNVTGDAGASPGNVQLPARWLRLSPFVPEVHDRIGAFYLNYRPTPPPLAIGQLLLHAP